jgi:hypothetical protein
MKNRGKGIPFTNFQHPFFFSDEVRYKRKACSLAPDILCFKKWKAWQKKPGKITSASHSSRITQESL